MKRRFEPGARIVGFCRETDKHREFPVAAARVWNSAPQLPRHYLCQRI